MANITKSYRTITRGYYLSKEVVKVKKKDSPFKGRPFSKVSKLRNLVKTYPRSGIGEPGRKDVSA